jgi:hypothetical protein
MPLAIIGGMILVVALLGYLIYQSTQEGESLSAAERAEQNDSTDLPGNFAATQGRAHLTGGLEGSIVIPFCEGVEQSELAEARGNRPYTAGTPDTSEPVATSTPAATNTPAPTPTTAAEGTAAGDSTAAGGSPTRTPAPSDCYASNPPSSGRHLNVQRGIEVVPGAIFNIPADPGVYDHDIEMPRNSIAHILEHAGVYVGWNCEEGNEECMQVVEQLESLVDDRIDNHDDRVVMSKSLDLPENTTGLSGWTRWLQIPYAEYEDREGEIEDFIGTHSCRFDPEGFCR